MGLFDQSQGLMGLGQQPQGDSLPGTASFQTGYRGVKPTRMGGFYAQETAYKPPQGYNQLGEFTGMPMLPDLSSLDAQGNPLTGQAYQNYMRGSPGQANFMGRPPPGYDQLGNFIGQNAGLGSSMPSGSNISYQDVQNYLKNPEVENSIFRNANILDAQGNPMSAQARQQMFGSGMSPMQQQPSNPVNTQTVQPNFLGQTPFGQPQTGQYSSSNPFVQAAQANAQGNLAGALQATAANRVNQQTPFGGLQYQQTGTDAQGNPIWSANQTIAQPYQNAINSLSSQIQQNFAQPFDTSQYQNQMVGSTPQFQGVGSAPQLGMVGQNPQFQNVSSAQQALGTGLGPQFQGVGQAPNLQTSVQGTGMQGWDQATNLLMSRLNPQIKQQNEASDAQLANQGIMPGSEAYNRAKTQIAQQQNDLLNQAQLAGSQIQNQMFNQNLAAGTFGNTALGNQNTMNLGNTAFNNALGQQGFANQVTGTQLGNQAAQQNFTNQLAGTGFNNALGQQGFANQLAGTQANNAALGAQNTMNLGNTAFNNALSQQGFGNQLAGTQANNAALNTQNTMNLGNTAFNNALGQQGFANQLSGTAANNAARQANFGQGLTQYQLPTSSLGSLRAATTPGYVNPYNQAAVAGPDYLSAYTSQNATDIAKANAQAAQRSSMLGGLTGLGASAILGGTGPNSALGGLYNLGSKGLTSLGNSSLWNQLFGGGGSAITGDQDFLKSIGLDNTFYGSGTGGMLTDPLAGYDFNSNYDPSYLDNFYNLGG